MLRLISPAPCCAPASQSDSQLCCASSDQPYANPIIAPARLISPVLSPCASLRRCPHPSFSTPRAPRPNFALPQPLVSLRSQVIHCHLDAMRCESAPPQSGSNHRLALPLPCVAIRCFTTSSPRKSFLCPSMLLQVRAYRCQATASQVESRPCSRRSTRSLALPSPFCPLPGNASARSC